MTFLRFKVLLVAGDVAAARALAPALAEAEAASPGTLAVSATEPYSTLITAPSSRLFALLAIKACSR